MEFADDSLPSVSVVVATFRREEVLCRTLQDLVRQSGPCLEIIVVDQTPQHQHATDICLQTLQTAGLIRYYRLPRPSLPAARNYGTHRARGEIVLFVDDDVRPDPNLVAAHAREYAVPEVGGVAGGRSYPPELGICEQLEPVGIIAPNSDHISNFSSPQRFESVDWASGCNMSFRKHLVEEIGGFDPRFTGSAAYEDVDFCFRLRRTGHRIVFSPEAHLVHLIEAQGGCGNRHHDSRYYRGFIHNSLLFSCKNLSLRQRSLVMYDRMLMSGALVRQRHNLRYLWWFIEAVARSTRECALGRPLARAKAVEEASTMSYD